MNPWSVQIELAEGCNKLCPFCGLNGIRNAPGGYKLMTPETVRNLAVQCGEFIPRARYEFAMHGEPLIHKDHVNIFRFFRYHLPKTQIQLTTNGGVLRHKMQQRLDAIYDSGVDFVILDTYLPERDELRAEAAQLTGIVVKDFYDTLNPEGWSPWHNHGRSKERLLVLMDDLGERDGEVKSRVIYNHAGNAIGQPVPEQPLKKTCTLPFRELTVCYNGNINLCCHDWGHEYVCGNVNERRLEDIWNGPEFTAARRMLDARDRNFGPCSRCNYPGGGRVGLLPKQEPVTAEDRKILRRVIAESPSNNGFPKVFPKSK